MDILNKLHPLERSILPLLRDEGTEKELVRESDLQQVEVVRALQWLSNKDVVRLEKEEDDLVILSETGLAYKDEGLPEQRFLASLDTAKTFEDIADETGLSEQEVKASIGELKRHGWIELDGNTVHRTSAGDDADFQAKTAFLNQSFPINVEEIDATAIYESFLDRGLVDVETNKILTYALTDTGRDVVSHDLDDDYIERVTSDILKEQTWKEKPFRAYDVTVNVPRKNYGRKHFVTEAIEYVKSIWLEMGFEEMTGDIVQTAFWNLDSLFVPQDHPAREMQDTFYVDGEGEIDEEDVYERIRAVHEDGGETGSDGWQAAYSKDEARRLMLRTHTTVLSAKTLAGLDEDDLPSKHFSIGRNYRNEALDWKHLFEFYQVEGIVVDPDANFRNLIGYLKTFFAKMGFPDARVRPGYFPYTEPSAEVDVYDPNKEEWVELGGAGIFRPEVTKPLLGFECPVLAWGLGLERIITDYYDIDDLRDIYRNDMEQLRTIRKFTR
jgi:phenylalanyl-tRNA synthetase alpha chain